jgi:ureidoglycolate lyase
LRTIVIEPLGRDAYAAFGQVIAADGAAHYPINGGMTDRYNDLAPIELGGPGARPMISIARGRPYALPLTLTMLERHPLGSQAFVSLGGHPFVSIVAPDQDGTPGVPRAFLVPPGQGINMKMNIWHAVLTPLEAEQDFLLVDRGGPGNNLEEHHLAEPWLVVAG